MKVNKGSLGKEWWYFSHLLQVLGRPQKYWYMDTIIYYLWILLVRQFSDQTGLALGKPHGHCSSWRQRKDVEGWNSENTWDALLSAFLFLPLYLLCECEIYHIYIYIWIHNTKKWTRKSGHHLPSILHLDDMLTCFYADTRTWILAWSSQWARHTCLWMPV